MLNMFCMQFTALYRIVYERIFINLASVWTRKNAELAWAGCSAAHHMFRRRDGDAKQSFPEPPASLRHLQRHFVTLYALTSCRLRLLYSPIARGGCTSLDSCYQQRRRLSARPPGRCDTMARWTKCQSLNDACFSDTVADCPHHLFSRQMRQTLTYFISCAQTLF